MSTIKLYRNCKITEEKNFQLDDIEAYLSTLTPVKTFENAQYIKQGLDTEVKVVLDQTYLDKQWTNNFNYCSIELDNGGSDNTYYYFIREMVWTSKNCIKLILRLDVLNTYNGAYSLSDKTTIKREHKDRFVKENISHQSVNTFFTDTAVWDWGTGAGEMVGTASILFLLMKGKEIEQPEITLVSGTGADVYETEWYADEGRLNITAYVQGESSPIPSGVINVKLTSRLPLKELKRKIDKVQEGFDTVLFNKPNETKKLTSTDEGAPGKSSCYLIYKTAASYNPAQPDDFIYNNAINCYFTTDTGYTSYVSTSTRVQNSELDVNTEETAYGVMFSTGRVANKKLPNSFAEVYPVPKAGDSVRIVGRDSGGGIVNTIEVKVYKTDDGNALKQDAVLIRKASNGTIYILQKTLKRDNVVESTYPVGFWLNFGTNITFENQPSVKLFKSTGETIRNIYWYDLFGRKGSVYKTFTASVQSLKTSTPYKDIDRTQQNLVKIIKLPYSPYEGARLRTLIWDENEHLFKIPNSTLNQDVLTNELELKSTGIALQGTIDLYKDLFIDATNISATTLRNDKFESKLYHSDFRYKKFSYDSFSYTFKNEYYNIDKLKEVFRDNPDTWNDTLSVKYIVSSNVSSSFLFDFSKTYPESICANDYPGIMIVNRNNEEPIYNNYYLNYLRNGYNYDVKNKQTSQVASGIGTALGAAQVVAGILTADKGGAGLIVSGAITIAGSLTSAITSSVSADRALQQKLEQARNQAATVQGADDIGLLSYYCTDNKAKLITYEVSAETKERLSDLFYYCGYKCDYQAVPDTTSRYWFNFIQCEPVFIESSSAAKMSAEQRAELILKYNQGVTVLHKHDNYDFEQKYENFETWLLNS